VIATPERPELARPVLTSLDFALPPDLEAHEPPEARGLDRDGVRLLVTYRSDDRIVHAGFRDLPRFLEPGDLLVLNDSATLPAALTARGVDGAELGLHLSTRLPADLWIVEPRGRPVAADELRGRPVAAGELLRLPAGGSATLLSPYPRSPRLWVARLDLPAPILPYLARHGRPIAYSYVPDSWPIEMYQTVYAAEPGSAEMPSAGRPFTREILDQMTGNGVAIATLTLHTGVASLEKDEPPYEEAFHVPPETADAVNRVRASGGRVVAVGTTVVRALESAADRGRAVAARGWTDLMVTPSRGVSLVDGLLTGLHEPKATHLAMLEAIAGRPHLERAYEAALEGRYLWHEFGDLHLIL
jgi:S-adenosylmethionine:tRNA ribosyltransferase-isomerase